MGSLRNRVGAVLCLAGGLGLCDAAQAQNLGAQAVTSGGGESSGGGIRHFSATGLGMAVGRTEGGGIVVYHGFLARAVAARDDEAPVFDPPPGNLRVPVPAGAQRCVATVDTPAIRVRDNRDRNPEVTVVLQTDPPQELDPDGDQVELPLGSYDVIVTAVDRRENRAQTTYRIDVVDTTDPVIDPIPDPTPVGREAEAVSPAGTPVALGEIGCRDVCDPNPVIAHNAPARFELRDTPVQITCRDRSNNQAEATVTVRVRDRTPPALAGDAPQDVARECNNPQGSTVAVPALVWSDNGYSADQLRVSLIADPGEEDERQYDPIPANITLTGGRHVLRFVARDPSGNQRTVDMNVNVVDRRAPRIEVVAAPELGWSRRAANIRIRITDSCGALGENIDVEIQPRPDEQQIIDGDILSLTYSGDGIYNLALTVTDSAGNQASDNSIGFGVDSSNPVPAVVVPPQAGVAGDNRLTFPVYAQAEVMPLNVGGSEPGDGVQSGVRRVQVILDPNEDGEGRVLVDRTYDGNGNPPRGARVVGNARCTDVNGDDALCTDDGELDLRRLEVGFHTLRTIVTDFAGNQAIEDAKFTNANLEFGLEIVIGRVATRLQQGNLAQGAVQQLQLALPKLARGRDVAAMTIAGSDYDTPVFLGSALKAVQDATINFQEAIAAAAEADQSAIQDMVALLHRIAWSDLELYRLHIEGLNLPARFPPGDQAWMLDDWGADMDAGDRYLDQMLDAIDANRWSQSAQNALESFFSHKNAHTVWVMNVRLQPFPEFNFSSEYQRGRDILVGIRDELNQYLRLDTKPAEANVRDIRDRLNRVIDGLNRLLRVGFDQEGGISDREYLELLLEIQAIGNASLTANNQGAWMRNYQFSIMQVVRWMTHASTVNAIFWVPELGDYRLFEAAISRIEDGVDLLLPPRRVEQAVQFYGGRDTICLIVGVYHCYYLSDEGREDQDEPYMLPDDSPCWDVMLRPNEWENAPEGPVPPQCRFGPDVRQ